MTVTLFKSCDSKWERKTHFEEIEIWE